MQVTLAKPPWGVTIYLDFCYDIGVDNMLSSNSRKIPLGLLNVALPGPLKLLGSITLFCLCTLTGQAQYARVVGKVIDRETQAAIPFANVYFNGSSIGASTDATGAFEITKVPIEYTELIASSVGYQASSTTLQLIDNKTTTVSFALAPDVTLLSAVTIRGQRDQSWQKLYTQFLTHFIGQTENAALTTVVNPNVLELTYDSARKKLTAYAHQPLEIQNLALGYRIFIVLENFEVSAEYYSMKIKSFFLELTPNSELEAIRWKQRRLRTYTGSERHFFSSAIKGISQQEGFHVHQSTADHHRDIQEFSNDRSSSTYSSELGPTELMLDSADGYFNMLQSGIFRIGYQPAAQPNNPSLSWIEIHDPHLSIYRNGIVKIPANFWRLGHFEKLRISDQLPADYDYWTEKRNSLVEPLERMGRITGVVQNEKGERLRNVSIFIDRGFTTTTTNFWGQFQLTDLPFGHYPLVFTHEGYQSVLNVVPVMQDGATEVVVTMKKQPDDFSDFVAASTEINKQILKSLHPQVRRLRLSLKNTENLMVKEHGTSKLIASTAPVVVSSRKLGFTWLIYFQQATLSKGQVEGEIFFRMDTLPSIGKIQKKRWSRFRTLVYNHSGNMLLNSLLEGTVEENGITLLLSSDSADKPKSPVHGDSLLHFRNGQFWLTLSDTLFAHVAKPGRNFLKMEKVILAPHQPNILLSPYGVYDPRALTVLYAGHGLLPLLPIDYAAQQNPRPLIIPSTPAEHIYLHTDKPYYHPGDTLWFKGTITTESESTESKVLYVDLLNTHGVSIRQLTLPVNQGRAPGNLWLPDYLPAGDYTLRAHTAYSAAGDEFFLKPLPILTKDRMIQSHHVDSSAYAADLTASLLTQATRVGDSIVVTVKVHEQTGPATGEFSISITNQDGVGELSNLTILDLSRPRKRVPQAGHVLEPEQGLMHRFRIRNGHPKESYSLSIFDPQNSFATTVPIKGDSGAFLLNVNDSTSVFLSCHDSRQNEYFIEIVEPDQPQPQLPEPLPYQTIPVTQRLVSGRKDSVIMLDGLLVVGKRMVKQALAVRTTEAVWGNFYISLNAKQIEDIRNTYNLVEELHTKIPRLNNPNIRFSLMVNGIFESPEILTGLPPGSISRVDVYPHPQNVVAIYTEAAVPYTGKNPNLFTLKGFSRVHTFSGNGPGSSGFQSTHYWNHTVPLTDGTATIRVGAPSTPGRYKIVVEGTTTAGKPFHLVEYLPILP